MVLDPSDGPQGAEQVVIVRGTATAFADGTCTARFPGGEAAITLVRAEAADRIRLLVDIPADAPLGPAALELDTPSGTFTPQFTIYPSETTPSVRFEPGSVPAGFSATLFVEGVQTEFATGVTTLSFEEDSGIAVRSLEVEGPTTLRVQVDVPATAAERDYAALVSTRGEALAAALHVVRGAGPSLTVEPGEAAQGSDVTIAVTATDFSFGTTNGVDFPWNGGIAVGTPHLLPATDTEPQHLVVDLVVAADAPIGATTLRVVSDGRAAFGTFVVLRTGTDPSCSFLSAAHAGDRSVPLQVIGRYTSFVYDGTTAEVHSPYVTVNEVVVAGDATLLLVASIDQAAAAGPVDVTFVSGAQRVTCALAIEAAAPATLVFVPDVLEHPAAGADVDTTVECRVTGLDLTGGRPVLAAEAGSGIAVPRPPTVRDAGRATAVLRVSRDAPYGVSTLTLDVGGTTVRGDLAVVRAAGDAPAIDPGYLLLDGLKHDLQFASPALPFLDGATPWPAALSAGSPGLVVTPSAAPDAAGWSFAAQPGIALAPGHRTVAAHGRAAAGGTARHLAARLTGVARPAAYATCWAGPLHAGADRADVVVTAAAPVFGDDTVAVSHAERGFAASGLRIFNATTATFGLDIDETALSGDYALVLVSRGIAVPTAFEILPSATPSSFTVDSGLAAGSSTTLTLAGKGTAWTSATRPLPGAADPALTLGTLAVASATAAELPVVAAPGARTGGHVVWLRTGNAVTPGLIWIGGAARAVAVAPGWLHAGVDETMELSGAALAPAAAVVTASDGVDALAVTARSADTVTVALRASAAAGTLAVVLLDPDGSGSPVPLFLPVLPAPPAAVPARLALPRVPRPTTIAAGLSGLDLSAGVSARVVGPGLYAGPATDAGGGLVHVDATLDVDAAPDAAAPLDRRWLVFLTETDAVALRVLPQGDRPVVLALGAADDVSATPDSPVLRALAPGTDGLAWLRVACADPAATTVSLLGADGVTVLARATGTAALPRFVPGPAETDGPAFLALETTAPTDCTLGHDSWIEFEHSTHDLEPNDDAGEEEPLDLGSLAYRHLARLAAGYDVDRYVADLPGPARIEAFSALPDDYPGRVELALEVTGPDGVVRSADPWDAGDAGAAAIAVDTPGTYTVAVRAVTGTDGPYVLSLHEPVLIDELDLWSGGPRFAELAAPPGFAIDGWKLALRSSAGATIAETVLHGAVPGDGALVVGAAAGATVDAVWAALATVSGAAVLAVVDPAGHTVDAVGFDGALGEGGTSVAGPAAPETPTSLGRCDRVDTDDSRADFWRQRTPTPGAPNACDYRAP